MWGPTAGEGVRRLFFQHERRCSERNCIRRGVNLPGANAGGSGGMGLKWMTIHGRNRKTEDRGDATWKDAIYESGNNVRFRVRLEWKILVVVYSRAD